MNGHTATDGRGSGGLGLGLALGSVASVMSALAMVPIMPQLFKSYGSVPNANFWLPALIAIPGFCSALLSPVAGYIGDKVNAMWPVVLSTVLYVLFGVAPFFSQDFSFLVATRFGLGVAQTGVLVITIAMIGHQFDEAGREKWLAVQAGVATGSSVVLLPISGFLASTAMGWPASFLIFVLGVPYALFMATRRLKPIDAHAGDHGAGAAIPWRWLLAQCLITCFAGVVFFATQFHMGLALARVGVTDTAKIGLILSFVSIGVVIGAALFKPAKNLLGKALLPFELVAAGATLLVVWQFQTIVMLVIFAFLCMVACGMMLPTLVTATASGLPAAVRGRGLGLWNSAFVLAQFIGSAFIGAVLARPGWTVLDAFGILGIASLVVGAAMVVLQPRARPQAVDNLPA